MTEILTQNKVKAVISMAPFEDGIRLKNAIVNGLADSGIKIESLNMDADIDMSTILSAVMRLDGSEEVNKAIMACLERCTYNSEKITPHLFDDEKAREDYYEIVIDCVRVNIAPFFKGLASKLPKITENLMGIPSQS